MIKVIAPFLQKRDPSLATRNVDMQVHSSHGLESRNHCWSLLKPIAPNIWNTNSTKHKSSQA